MPRLEDGVFPTNPPYLFKVFSRGVDAEAKSSEVRIKNRVRQIEKSVFARIIAFNVYFSKWLRRS